MTRRLVPRRWPHSSPLKPSKPTPTQFTGLLIALLLVSLGGGYYAGTQPTGEWRYFSWHPFLMSVGMIGMAGIGAIVKKLGGYTNTKVRDEEGREVTRTMLSDLRMYRFTVFWVPARSFVRRRVSTSSTTTRR